MFPASVTVLTNRPRQNIASTNERSSVLILATERRSGSACHDQTPSLTSISENRPMFLDMRFPTSNLRAELRVPDSPVPSLPPLPSLLSQPLFPPSKDHANSLLPHGLSFPALTNPNSPYVPWDSPARQEFLLLSPASSQHTHTHSDPGILEPPTEDQDVILAKPYRLKRVLRTFRRNVSGALRRIGKSRQPIPEVQVNSFVAEPWESRGDVVARSSQLRRMPSMSACSVDSSNTTSLATWLAYRRQKQLDNGDTALMSLEEYERRGSWMATGDDCGLADCSVHRHRTRSISSVGTHDSRHRPAVTLRSRRSSVSVSVRSKRSASRMSLTRPAPLRLSKLVHSNSFILDSPLRLAFDSPPRLAPTAERASGESSLSQEITASLQQSSTL